MVRPTFDLLRAPMMNIFNAFTVGFPQQCEEKRKKYVCKKYFWAKAQIIFCPKFSHVTLYFLIQSTIFYYSKQAPPSLRPTSGRHGPPRSWLEPRPGRGIPPLPHGRQPAVGGDGRGQVPNFPEKQVLYLNNLIQILQRRYITWPGQATAYAMGERKIR